MAMTQELYQKAMKFAGEKHFDQKVPGTNANYLLHISNVAMEILVAYNNKPDFDIDFAVQTAILHDTIEDTTCDYSEIEIEFGERVAKAVQALTKDKVLPSKKESMLDSLTRINQLEKEVGMVKLADRITNLQSPPGYWNQKKIINYQEEAVIIVDSLQDKNEYLESRLRAKIEAYKQYIA
ncbi:HD domain-containing protein [Aquimarina sediminis]|uniref:HD domain-containing protein n=1 Tax=Aquimarina sediminis TaxID=2070536 RepID=UPI001F4DF814|nr:HD domain-containing protein [Aquimarina sediminis]